MTSEKPARRRAPAMEPDQRRAMIVAAALPLVVEYGANVTTAKVARAAGIGEGTIFRVFEDKNALLKACMEAAVRPDETVAHLASIDLDQPLADRLTEAAEVMCGHMERMGEVIGALAATGQLERREPPKPDADGRFPSREAGLAGPRAALTALFAPDESRLRLSPERLASAFQLLLMSAGRVPGPDPLTPRELADLFLHGALGGAE
ncbi:TetR family transcriptional regulator [Streptomyces spiroverticillatus]|uniref:TetR family transcriptional regulator n=1 Tax=Streptomyces finlayi TaxID=67296 RepID=A0A918X2G5_9ACTN|nr:TetR/AcrR family transcriptional regulator [Streptomyces finlayi]GHA22519.1 TetR family transcriptional regulator [Streptomyces spiroverticillatus]GHD04450.1 TetR family transcriptional regulator [Streptomyces finlayi]